jgi:Glucose / Sorbosone dehydrogenase
VIAAALELLERVPVSRIAGLYVALMAPCPLRSRTSTLVVAIVCVAILHACGGDPETKDGRAQTLVADARVPGPIATLREGGFIFGERATGKIRLVDAEGRLQVDPVAELEVGNEEGLLGLAVDIGERIYASWVDPSGRLTVGWVDAAAEHVFWRGPPVGGAVGGQLGFSPNGDLVLAVGDLGEPSLVDDAGAPNGKLLALDPHEPPDQTPEIYSKGWSNPLAFAFDDQGALWVADAPDSGAGRLVRVVGKKRSVRSQFESGTVPSGMAALGTDVILCDSAGGELRFYRGAGSDLLAEDCSGGVATSDQGSVLYSSTDAIREVETR